MTVVHDEPSAYLRDLHASVAAPRRVLDDLVRRATGSTIDEIERIVRGYVNEVYRIRTAAGSQISVRLRRFAPEEERTAELEAWAMEQARHAGAPVADVLLAERLRLDDGEELPAMVVEWLPGVPLANVEHRLTDSERTAVLERMGAAFALINSVPVGGFWVPSEEMDWSELTSEFIMTGYLAQLDEQREDAHEAGVTSEEYDRTLDLLRFSINEFPYSKAVLCHNDMSPEHVLVDDDLNVTGVIDFGAWCGGSDVGDVGHLRFARPDLDLAAVLRGYGSPELHDETFLVRLRLQALGQAIGHLNHYARQADQANLIRTRQAFRGLLEELRVCLPNRA